MDVWKSGELMYWSTGNECLYGSMENEIMKP